MIKIVPPEANNDKLCTGRNTVVLNQSGEEIEGITGIKLDFRVDSFVSAEVTVVANMDSPVWAMPFMSEESFLRAASKYGYEVKKLVD